MSGWLPIDALPDRDAAVVAGELGVNLEVWLAKRKANPELFTQGAL